MKKCSHADYKFKDNRVDRCEHVSFPALISYRIHNPILCDLYGAVAIIMGHSEAGGNAGRDI